jgi:hypothetical protein
MYRYMVRLGGGAGLGMYVNKRRRTYLRKFTRYLEDQRSRVSRGQSVFRNYQK